MALRPSGHSHNIGRKEVKRENGKGGREGWEKNKEDGMQKIKEEPNLEENNQRNKKFLASSSCYRRP